MLKLNLEKDYSNSIIGVEVESLSPDKIEIGLGEGIENIKVAVSKTQAEQLTEELLNALGYDIIEKIIDCMSDDETALKLTEKLIKNVYGERTLEEAEDTITTLEMKLEMAEEKIDQLEEFHGIRF